jgi:hypothetical protein
MRLSHPPFFLQTLRHPSCNGCYSGEDTLLSRNLRASINLQSHLSLWSERIVYLTLVTISVFATIVVYRIVSNSIRVCGVMKLWWCWNYSSIGPTSFAGRTPNPRGKEEVGYQPPGGWEVWAESVLLCVYIGNLRPTQIMIFMVLKQLKQFILFYAAHTITILLVISSDEHASLSWWEVPERKSNSSHRQFEPGLSAQAQSATKLEVKFKFKTVQKLLLVFCQSTS